MRNITGISKAQWRKDAPSLLLCCAFIAFIPVAVVMARPRPLAANSPGELISIAREQTAEEAVTILSRHKNSWAVQSPESRWKEIEQSLYESDNDLTTEEVTQVLEVSKPYLQKRSWPLFAKQAWLNNQKVWLVASGDDLGDGNYFCGMTTQKEKRDWKIEAAKNVMTIVVITTGDVPKVLTH